MFVLNGPPDTRRALVKIMAWRRQAIIWTNADPIQWRINAALWGDELNNKNSDTLQIVIILSIFASISMTEKFHILTNFTDIRSKGPISSRVALY